jgi:uncharacterized protein (TIRG00374 family)
MRRAVRWLIWPVVVALLIWAVRGIDGSDVARRLSAIQAWQWLVLLSLNSAIVLVFSGRWWVILRGLGPQASYLHLALYRLAGFSVSYFTPGSQFGGEPLQVDLLHRRQAVPVASAVASVTLDKALEVLGNSTFLAFGLVVLVRLRWLDSRQAALPGLLAGVLLVLPLGLLLAWWAGKRPLSCLVGYGATRTSRRWRGVERWAVGVRALEAQAGDFCRKRPLQISLAMGFSLLSWIGIVLERWMMLWFLGAALGPAETIAVVTAGRLALLLPVPAGLGALDASQVFAVQALGLDPAIGVSLSLLIRLRDLLFGGLGLILAARWGRAALGR